MIRISNLQNAEESSVAGNAQRVLTAGVFDGLHLAHQHLVRRVVQEAHVAATPGTAMVFTFANHPLTVLAPPYAPKQLLTTEEKIRCLEKMGIDVLFMPEFTLELGAIEPERFIADILVGAMRIDKLVVGFDFRFGHEGQGDAALLREKAGEYGFDLEVLSAIHHEDRPVSSTHVRELIDTGRVRMAAEILGRPYSLCGPVVSGYGRGTKMGFPTANLEFDPLFAIPASGVYAVRVEVEKQRWNGMMNIGTSPTFEGTEYRPEVFLMDFEGDLYGKSMRVEFVERLREERKFESVHALQERLRVDESMARGLLDSHPTIAWPPNYSE